MTKIQQKLWISVISLLVAVALIVSASLAWMTLSTSTETKGISLKLSSGRSLLLSIDDKNYDYTLDLSAQFKNLAPLHPVSTADGVHWYIPTYNDDKGTLKSVEDFILDYVGDGDGALHDNVSIAGLTGLKLLDTEDTGYYVWTDFYIKTEEEKGAEVHLSIPKTVDPDELKKNGISYYGSYVLPSYELKDDTLKDIGYGAETAVRVGFLITETDDKGKETTRFVIYEPNADKRSATRKPKDSGDYVKSYDLGDEYVDGNYIETKPVTYMETTAFNKVTYTQYTPGGSVPKKLYVEREYVMTGYDVNSGISYYTYSAETGYQLYTGKYDEIEKPTLYKKNIVKADSGRYFEDDRHYLIETYKRYNGDYEAEAVKPTLYTKARIGNEDVYGVNNQPYSASVTYYVKTYQPYNFKEVYEVYEGDYESVTEKPVLYVKTGAGESATYTPTAYDPANKNKLPADKVTYYVKVFQSVEVTAEDEEEMANLYAYGFEERTYDENSGLIYYEKSEEEKKGDSAQIDSLSPDSLIVQKQGAYDTAKVKEALGKNADATLDSSMVGTFGRFVNPSQSANGGYSSMSSYSTETFSDTVIVKLEKDKSVKIRLFIWIEGQDVDCWNDITSGWFNINLEFAAYTE